MSQSMTSQYQKPSTIFIGMLKWSAIDSIKVFKSWTRDNANVSALVFTPDFVPLSQMWPEKNRTQVCQFNSNQLMQQVHRIFFLHLQFRMVSQELQGQLVLCFNQWDDFSWFAQYVQDIALNLRLSWCSFMQSIPCILSKWLCWTWKILDLHWLWLVGCLLLLPLEVQMCDLSW